MTTIICGICEKYTIGECIHCFKVKINITKAINKAFELGSMISREEIRLKIIKRLQLQ